MNLSTIQAGPGAQMQGDLSIILEALLKVIQNNNEQQKQSFEMQSKAAEGQSKAIIASAKDQASATRQQGVAEWSGSLTSGVITVGGQGTSMKLRSSVSQMDGQLEGISAFRGKLTTTQASQAAAEESAARPVHGPITKESHDFLHGKTPESAQVLSRGNLTPEQHQAKLDRLAVESQGNRQQAQERADKLHDEIKTQRDGKSRDAELAASQFNTLGQAMMGLVRGTQTAASAEAQEEQGYEEAVKMIFALLLEFGKGIKETTASQIQTAQQQITSAIQLLDATVFQASHRA